MTPLLDRYRHLAFFVVLFITFGTWLDKVANWSDLLQPDKVGTLLILLGTNFASNKVKDVWNKPTTTK